MAETRMVVEVWSHIMCPFCFLGKRRFAAALEHFAQSRDVAVTWRSFQLNPTLRSDATMSVNEYLTREKGIDPAQAAPMHDRLVRLGENAGIEFNFDRAMVANTFDAHRMIHLAASRGKEDAAVERLFTAYFTEGKNIADHTVLADLGRDMDLDPNGAPSPPPRANRQSRNTASTVPETAPAPRRTSSLPCTGPTFRTARSASGMACRSARVA